MVQLNPSFTNFFKNVDILKENYKYLICVNCKGYSKNKVYKVAKAIDKINYEVFYNFSEIANEYFSFYASDERDVSSFFDEFMNIYNSLDIDENIILKDDRDFYCEFLSCGSSALKDFLEFSYDNDINVLYCYHKSSFERRLGISFDIEESYRRNYNFFDMLDMNRTVINFFMNKLYIVNFDITDDGMFYTKLKSAFKMQSNNCFNFLEMYNFFKSFNIKKINDEYIVSLKFYDISDKDKLYKIIKTCIDFDYIVFDDADAHFGFVVKSLEKIDDKFLEFKKHFEKIDYVDYDEVNDLYKDYFKTKSNILQKKRAN